MATFEERLLEQYKKIYFDEQYYLEQRAAAYQANGKTAPALTMSAWDDFRINGAVYVYNVNGKTINGINPSQYFDVNRYYEDKGGDTYPDDPITDYVKSIVAEYQKSDPAKTIMPITPKRVGLGMTQFDATQATSSSSPTSHLPIKEKEDFAHNLQWFPLHFVNGLPLDRKANWPNWNYIGLTQGNVLYYSFDTNPFEDDSWARKAATNNITTNIQWILRDKWPNADTYCELERAYHDYCRTVLSMITVITGITFQETLDVEKSNIHFIATNLSDQSVISGTTVGQTCLCPDRSSAVLFIHQNRVKANVENPDYELFETIAHEVGHMFGLKHPYPETGFEKEEDRGIENDFHNNAFNSYDYTIMTYRQYGTRYALNNDEHGGSPVVYGPRDILALQDMYGTDGLNGKDGFVYNVERGIYLNRLRAYPKIR